MKECAEAVLCLALVLAQFLQCLLAFSDDRSLYFFRAGLERNFERPGTPVGAVTRTSKYAGCARSAMKRLLSTGEYQGSSSNLPLPNRNYDQGNR
jgi:hypothetical protein